MSHQDEVIDLMNRLTKAENECAYDADAILNDGQCLVSHYR